MDATGFERLMSRFLIGVEMILLRVLRRLAVCLPLLGALVSGTPSLALADVAAPAVAVVGGSTLAGSGGDLKVFNRKIFEFRSVFLGVPPEQRAVRAQTNIEALLAQNGDFLVVVEKIDQGELITIDGKLAFVVTPGDVDPLQQADISEVAANAGRRLEKLIAETREGRSFDAIVRSLVACGLATVVLCLLFWSFLRARVWVQKYIVQAMAAKVESLTVAGATILDGQPLYTLMHRVVGLFFWLLIVLSAYEWLSFVLSRFPYTRPWGENLDGYLFGVFVSIAQAIVAAVPGLGVALAIFLVARFCNGLLGGFFERLAKSDAPVPWLDKETMPTTRKLVAIAVWLFALAMAYPYLPGAQTEAFKGLSVLVGLMVSLGASSIIGQGAAGLILTYSRTIRVGEYVRIGDHEGTVTEMGMFTSRIRTGLGEELTLPNSMIAGTVTKNYSRAVQGRGYIVDTVVTIGYDTPWRQVEAMLLEAAKRTNGILDTPTPRVFQTGLADYYPVYRLVGQAIPAQPRPRAEVLNMLHANIQDVFNEYGVQIMSPNYRGDPEQAKVVPPDQWYLAPAEKPDA